jgi:transcriptional regulator GlxA family with amidase domain
LTISSSILPNRHNLDSLGDVVSMSRRTLTRHFIKATGMSVADWLTAERLRRSQIYWKPEICRLKAWPSW